MAAKSTLLNDRFKGLVRVDARQHSIALPAGAPVARVDGRRVARRRNPRSFDRPRENRPPAGLLRDGCSIVRHQNT
jgi:hypothetical protein